MSDNEIIKALECCQSPTAECKNCPMPKDIQDDCRCMETITRNALSLINRQKAEIERLTKENDELKNGFFQEHYKEIECQELLSVKEAWRKESLHNIGLEAEIERLKAEQEMADGYAEALEERAQANAIKEFAERLKAKQKQINITYNLDYDVVFVSEIDNLVKEMVGDTE